MKFEALVQKIDELKVLHSSSIGNTVLRYRAVPVITADRRDSWSRVTKLFCPYCGLEQELVDNDSLCHRCGELINKDNTSVCGQYRTYIFEDNGDKYVLSTYVTPEFSHNSLNICEVSKLTYEDVGYGFYSADGVTKAVYSASGSKKQRSRNAYSYAEIDDFTGSGIWNVMPNNSRYWLFWDDVDNASTATKKKISVPKSPVYANIIFNKPENKDVADLLFHEMYEDRVTGTTHYEVWCQHCGKLFEADLKYSENAVCPDCGAEDNNRLGGYYSTGQLQINKNGNDIDIVRYNVRADDNFNIEVDPQCAFKIDAKGKTTCFDYQDPKWERISRSNKFNWGHIDKISVDPQLQDYNFKVFEDMYNGDSYHGRRCITVSPMEVRRFFEGCQKNELIKNLAGDPLAMKVVLEFPEKINSKAKTPHELFGMSEDVYEFAHDNNIPLMKARKTEEVFPGYSPEFYKLTQKVTVYHEEYLEGFKDLVDSLTEHEPEILDFFEQQKKDGLRENDAYEALRFYLFDRETLGLVNIPELPEHILVERQKLDAATRNRIYRYATSLAGNERFSEHANEFSIEQLVSCYFVDTGECDEMHYSTNGPDLVISDDNGAIIAIIEPDGTIK